VKLNITTTFTPKDAIITQELKGLAFGNDEVIRWIINTREQQIHDALIALGWTPAKMWCIRHEGQELLQDINQKVD
jgi:hypothetical protein